MFASEGPLIGFPPSIGAILRKKCRQHNELGHASCHVVLLARNCCVTTVLSYFVVDALLGHVCRDRARDCTTDSSPQPIAHCVTMPSASRARRRAEFPPWSKFRTSQEWVYFPPKNSVGVPMLSLHVGCMRHVFFDLCIYFGFHSFVSAALFLSLHVQCRSDSQVPLLRAILALACPP